MRMRSISICVLLLMTAIAPVASAGLSWDSGMAVFMTYPKGDYTIGDDLIVTVHVFNEGEYYTPDDVELIVDDETDIGLTEEAEGRYKGVISITADVLDDWGDLELQATATDEGIIWDFEAYDWDYVSTGSATGLSVEVRLKDSMDLLPRPGDEVEFQVLIMYGEDDVDPDADTLEVMYIDPSDSEHDLDVTRIGTGMFEGVFTVPASLKESSTYYLIAYAEYTTDTDTLDESSETEVDVQFLDVWAHITDVSPSTTELEIVVLDLDGQTVEGADIDITWTYEDDAWDEQEGTTSGATGADGRAAFTLSYTDLGMDSYSVDVEGKAESDGYTQRFVGTLYAREYTGDSWEPDEGFYVEVVNSGPYEGGESITLEHIAKYDKAPMPSTDIYFYLVDDHDILRFGEATTDALGKFSFPLNIPEADPDEMFQYIECNYHMEGEYSWEESDESIFVGDLGTDAIFDEFLDPKTTMSLNTFSAGEKVVVSIDHPDADGTDEMALVIWGLGEMPDWEDIMNLEWESWNPAFISTLRMVPGEWKDDHFEATFACPSFLTTDDEMFMYGIIVMEDEGDIEDAGHAAKKTGVFPLPPNPPPTATVTSHTADEKVGGKVKFSGASLDDTSVEKVEVSIDGGDWMTVTGTTDWEYEVDTTTLTEGNHTLEVRSYDGEKYSDPVSITFEVDQSVAPKDDKKDDEPGFGAAIVLVALLAAVLYSRRRR